MAEKNLEPRHWRKDTVSFHLSHTCSASCHCTLVCKWRCLVEDWSHVWTAHMMLFACAKIRVCLHHIALARCMKAAHYGGSVGIPWFTGANSCVATGCNYVSQLDRINVLQCISFGCSKIGDNTMVAFLVTAVPGYYGIWSKGIDLIMEALWASDDISCATQRETFIQRL